VSMIRSWRLHVGAWWLVTVDFLSAFVVGQCRQWARVKKG
jgi:hypothetical protein